ncbi:increased DNA methylation 1-like isoform X2 [Phalaenopsis equestris]|uniref:increased DNA methylation 1-like isoform X2 n=1 Tax=Phalaenopsis equestris TaxID=78828 RepID=UPI0009E3C7E0|nr:increased DNA methylation 1-like isoform X2 [Phalaenopsis equestris]
MAIDGQTVGKGLKEEAVMIILFGEEIESLSYNWFDGSKEECQIFSDIFYGVSPQDESNSCAVSRASNFHRASNSHRVGVWGCNREARINFNLENSNITSCSSMNDASGEALELAKIVNSKDTVRSDYMLKSFGSAKLNSRESRLLLPGVLDKENLQRYGNYHYENSELVKPVSHDYRPFSFCIVESFAHGILSSYYSVKQLCSMDVASDNVNCAILNHKSSIQEIGDNKVKLDSDFVTSPVSQESIASGLVKRRSTVDVKEYSGVASYMDEPALETLKRHPSAGFSKRVTTREMADRLESYAHGLLADTGWIIETRVRRERSRLAFLFRKPDEGLARFSLSSAWKKCGERLLYTASESEKDDRVREWSDINEFWSDLKDILAYIDMNILQQENKLSFIRRWQLLDPFLTVVFIDRKLSILRMGKLLRAVNSATLIPGCSKDMCDVNMNESRKRKSKCLSSKCKLAENHLLALNPTETPYNFGCDSPVSSDLESENPCGSACKLLAENALQQETTSLLHKSSLDQLESQSFNETNGFSMKEKLVHGLALTNATEISLGLKSADAFSAKETSPVKLQNYLLKKAHKKSKKISKIKEAEVPGRKSRPISKRKHRENVVHSLDDSNSNLPDLPCNEASDMLTSECLEPSLFLKRRTGNVLSTSEDESSHTSKIQDYIKIDKRTLKLENKTARRLTKDMNEIPFIPAKEKTAITSSSLSEGQDGMLLHKLMKNGYNDTVSCFDNHSTVISLYKSPTKSRKIKHQCSNSKEAFVTTCDVNIRKTSWVKDSGEKVFSPIEGLCRGSDKSHKVWKAIKSEDRKGGGKKRSHFFHFNDDDLLISAILKKKDVGVSCKKFPSEPEFPQLEPLRKMKSQKRGCRLLPRNLGSDGKLSTDGKQFFVGTRTILGWLIDMAVVSLKDVIEFREGNNHEVIKDGWLTRDGIICNCCSQFFSVSGFKAHAGLRQQRPSLNLYLKSGRPYTVCQLQAWSAEYKLRKGRLKVMNVVEVDQNDDTCGICADGGELICCDNCPSTYHQSCLSVQELPEGSWYCANCTCKICNNLACKKGDSGFLAVFVCSQCGHKYHGTCIIDKVAHCGYVGSNTWFCGDKCKKVFWGLRSSVGMPNLLEDGFSWTILRCNHDDQNVYSPLKIALMAECHSKLAIALSLMEECFLPMVDPRTGIDIVPNVLYNLGSSFPRLNCEGFYSIILEKGDVLISVASIRVHGVKVAEMPLISTCGLQRRKGMCRRLMNAIETGIDNGKEH